MCLSEELVTCKLQVPGLGLLGSGHQPCCMQLLPHTLLPITHMGQIYYNHVYHINHMNHLHAHGVSSTTMTGGHVADSMQQGV